MKVYKISDRTLVILTLLVLILFIGLIPVERIVGRPSIIGAMVAKVFVRSLETNNSCTVNLFAGWNLVGIPCKPNDQSIGSALNSISGNYTSIHTYNASEDMDHWKSYNPNMPGWVIQDLSVISEKSGYWIKIDDDSVLNVNGTITSPNSIELVQGWNLIGYPSSTTKIPSDAFSTISGSYSIVWTYNTSQDAYLYYSPTFGTNTLTSIDTNRGYWINMTGGDDLWIT